MKPPADKARKVMASNRRAFKDYLVLGRFEAGIALHGTEVKSVRDGQVNLTGSYARIHNDDAVLYINIPPYEFGNRFNHDANRPRRLLLHRKEISRLQSHVEQKGCTLVPLSLYAKKGLIKVELGLCKGKRQSDKRETLRRKTADREAERAIARRRDRSG
jgi:SsrA-binding protein